MNNNFCNADKFKKLIFTGLLLFSFAANSQDFVAVKVKTENIKCSLSGSGIRIQGIKKSYTPYDKNLKIKKIDKCGITKIENLNLVNVSFDAEIKEGPNEFRASILEIAAYDPKKNAIRTIRSEIIDQVPETGDPAESTYEITAGIEWGFDKKSETLKLKILPISKSEKVAPYYLKMNKTKTWLENDFSDSKK